MEDMLINGYGFSTVCRLCLSHDSTAIDIFRFSNKMESQIAYAIMKCAPVQITKQDEMPKLICRLCYNQLEKNHEFQSQIVQSDKTLRHYLQKLRAPDKQMKTACSNQQTCEDLTNQDLTDTCESLDLHCVIDNYVTESKNGNSLSSTERADDTLSEADSNEISREDTKVGFDIVALDEEINVKNQEKEPENQPSAVSINDEVSLNSEKQIENSIQKPVENLSICDSDPLITPKCEPLELQDVFDADDVTNDDSSFSSENADDIFSKNSYSEISCEETKVDIREASLDQDMSGNSKEKEPAKFNSADGIKCEASSKLDRQVKNVSNRPADNTGNVSSNANGNEVNCEDMNTNIDCTTRIFGCIRSADVKIDKRKENKNNTSINPIKHKNGNRYQCDVCNKCFSLSDQFKDHKRTHTGERPYKCTVCTCSFSQAKTLKRHETVHKSEKPYQCDVCNKCFAESRYLNKHKRVHNSVKPYRCNVCDKCYTLASSLNTHKRIHTGVKPYQCDVCNKRFFELYCLAAHKRVHTGEKLYRCDVCNKCFAMSNQLYVHKRIHTGVKPYQCDVCSRRFSQSSHFNTHKYTHTGEKPYQCDICNKCYTQFSNLVSHKLTHANMKPYQCEVCNKCFTTSGYLNIHKRIHTGEKPYKCDVCNKCFPQSSNLTAHKRKHMDVKQYQWSL